MATILKAWFRVIGWPVVACEHCGRMSWVWRDHHCADAFSETYLEPAA